jgi:hypothetical protein
VLRINYPVYGGGFGGNLDTLHGRAGMDRFKVDLPRRRAIRKVLESPLFRSYPNRTKLVFLDCYGDSPPWRRRRAMLLKQLSMVSISAAYSRIDNSSDQGLPAPPVNPVVLTADELRDVATCNAESNRSYLFSFVGSVRNELFQARVNLDALRSQLGQQHRVFWRPDAYPGSKHPVLIKVSSKSCFHLLIPTHAAYLYSLPKDADTWELREGVRVALSQSLHGVYVTPDRCGLVQLLPDLLRLEYEPLPDGEVLDAAGWVALWRAFASLVTEVLIPLARAGIVRPDARIGYDATSNVLYNVTDGAMRLIDLDSLCAFEDLLDLPDVTVEKYPSAKKMPGKLKSAMGFVLGQVVCAAEVLLGRTLHNEVQANATVLRALRPVTNADNPGVFYADDFDEDGTFQATVDDALIGAVLERYRGKFDSRGA